LDHLSVARGPEIIVSVTVLLHPDRIIAGDSTIISNTEEVLGHDALLKVILRLVSPASPPSDNNTVPTGQGGAALPEESDGHRLLAGNTAPMPILIDIPP